MKEPEPNPYLPPDSHIHGVDSEESIRRDGKRLIISIYGGLHSVCAHCGSRRDLVVRTANVVCTNSIGCFAAIGLFIVAVAAAVSLEQNFLPYAVVTWVVALAAFGIERLVVPRLSGRDVADES